MGAPGFKAKDAVGAGGDFDAGEEVEGNAEVVGEDRFDRVAVAEEGHGLIGVLATEFFEVRRFETRVRGGC